MADVAAALRRASRTLGDDQAAHRLLADCLGQSWGWVSLHHDHRLSSRQAERLDQWLGRAARGEPLAHITGRAGFWTLELRVTPDVLIPRPATEALVDAVLARRDAAAPCTLLDLGTGSGAIALAIASERPDWAVTATDRSAAALNLASHNAAANDLDRVQFMHGHWFDAVAGAQFDVIVSNPPYIAPDDPELEPGVRDHEPADALLSGDDGLADLFHIIDHAPQHLRAGGLLAVEHGHRQAGAVAGRMARAGFAGVESRPDLEGHPRIALGTWP